MNSENKKAFTLPLRILIGLFFLGILISIMHWPAAYEIMIVSLAGIAILYPFRFYKKENKRVKDYIKLVLAESWVIGIIFSTQHWPFSDVLQIISSIAFWAWLGAEAYDFFFLKKTEPLFFNLSLWSVISTAFVIAGALFKIMHWPYANVLLITGFVCLVAWFIKDSFFNKGE